MENISVAISYISVMNPNNKQTNKQINSLESHVLFCHGIYKHNKEKNIYFLR